MKFIAVDLGCCFYDVYYNEHYMKTINEQANILVAGN